MSATTRAVYANGPKMRERLLDMRISEREIARRTRLGDATIRSILRRNQINTSIQIADLYRLLEELGLSASQFLDAHTPDEPDDTSDDDINALAGLIMSERIMHMPERLALALGWTLDRLNAAVKALDARLQPAGLKIHRNSMGITIRAATNNAETAIPRLADLADDQDGIHQGTARVLYAAYTGTLSTRELRNDHQVQLGALKNRGAIAIDNHDGNRLTITPDVAYSLNPHQEQP